MRLLSRRAGASLALGTLLPGTLLLGTQLSGTQLPASLATLPTASVASADAPAPDLVTREMRYCASLGAKPPGRRSTRTYSRHLANVFERAGLRTRFERFHLPRYDVSRQRIEVVGTGARRVPGETFTYGGTGVVEARVVDVGVGRPSDYAGKDVRGKIVMVERNEAFHRSSQLTQVEAHGGAAMLYVSGAPGNLVQTGTVRFAQDEPATIPAMTVGAEDGARLRDQLESSGLRMRLEVRAERVDAIGRNVIGVRRGSVHPRKYIVVAGHYDNWHAGAVDNCSSMGSLVKIIRATRDLDPAYTIIFAAWDAEEIGLTGSYDFVRRHPRIVDSTVVNENLEMVSASTHVAGEQLPTSVLNLMFGTTSPAMNAVVYEAATRAGFTPAPTTATAVRSVSGGIIPTDLQPFYARGVQGFSTFSSSPYYHTREESPDKIDEPSHVRVTDYLTNVLTDLQQVPPGALEQQEVPTVAVAAPKRTPRGRGFRAVVTVTDPLGNPVEGVPVRVLVNQRDHWAVAAGHARELGEGRYGFRVRGRDLRRRTTWLTATVDQPLYQATGFARVRHPR
jgi:aminopeptidase YwaD